MTQEAKVGAAPPGVAGAGFERPNVIAAAARLTRPATASAARVRWIYAIPIVVVHLMAVAVVVPWLFTWAGLLAFLVGVPLFGQGINLCYHRLLTHRSFRVPRWLEHVLVVFTLCSLEDTPIAWVATHRLHHTHSDEQPDPHSPLVNFLWSHVGWLILVNRDTRSLGTYQNYARDLVSDRFYRRLEAHPLIAPVVYLVHALVLTAAGAALGGALGGVHGAIRGAASMLAWGVILRTVAVWHVTWSVNSLTHLFGYRTYGDTGDNSRNNWLVGLIGSGEGWHNNHHHDPTAATVQNRWWEVDATYYMIVVLRWVGLATEVVPPRAQREAEVRARIAAKG